MKPSPLQLEAHFFTRVHVDAHTDGNPTSTPVVQAQVDVAQAERDAKRYQLTLRLTLDHAAGQQACYTGEIHVVGVLHVVDGWPERSIEQMVQVNGPALLYGAAREMLCNVTARGPWPMVCLNSVTFLQPKAAATQVPAEPTPTLRRIARPLSSR